MICKIFGPLTVKLKCLETTRFYFLHYSSLELKVFSPLTLKVFRYSMFLKQLLHNNCSHQTCFMVTWFMLAQHFFFSMCLVVIWRLGVLSRAQILHCIKWCITPLTKFDASSFFLQSSALVRNRKYKTYWIEKLLLHFLKKHCLQRLCRKLN